MESSQVVLPAPGSASADSVLDIDAWLVGGVDWHRGEAVDS